MTAKTAPTPTPAPRPRQPQPQRRKRPSSVVLATLTFVAAVLVLVWCGFVGTASQWQPFPSGALDEVLPRMGTLADRLPLPSFLTPVQVQCAEAGRGYRRPPVATESSSAVAAAGADDKGGHHGEVDQTATGRQTAATTATGRRRNMAPFVADVIAHLPRHLRPTASNGRRLIFVGDVHGMRASLEELLRKVDFRLESEAAEPYEEDGEEEKIARKNEGEGNSAGESKKSRRFRRGDHLILTGDMVNKGPGTVGLVSLLRSLGASAVRGNHEDRVLRAAISEGLLPHHGSKKHQKKKKKKKNKTGAEVDSTPSTAGDEVELGQGTVVATSLQPSATEEAVMVDDASQSSGSSSSHGASTVDDEVREARRRADIVVAHALGKENLVWLSRLPVILRLGSIPSTAVPGFGKLDSEEQLNDDGGQHQESQQRQHRLGEVVVVHAGLVPGVRLSQQDPWAVMNMRSLVHATSSADAVDREGNIDKGGDENVDADADVDADVDPWSLAPVFQPVHTREGTNWARQWDRWQERLLRREERRRRRPLRDVGDIDQIALKQDHLPPDRALAASTANVPRAADHSSAYSNHPAVPMTVVYGHDSKRGLRVGAWTLGLDTGCVAGGRLTALVISGGEGKREVTHRLVSVDCRAEAAEWERIKAASKAASVWK